MNKLIDMKPIEGRSVIAKTDLGTIHPCMYNDEEFTIIRNEGGSLKDWCVIHDVTEWQYEIQIPEPIIADDIFLELFCQKEDSIQDNVVYSKFIDAWNSLNIEDRILLVSSITEILKKGQI